MCLYVNKDVTVPFQDGKATLYKLAVVRFLHLEAPFASTPMNAGTIRSNREDKELTPPETQTGEVNHGIHCFLHYASAVFALNYNQMFRHCREFAIVKVSAKEEDLVATGTDGNGSPTAVFTQVELPQGEFDKAVHTPCAV